MLIPYTRQNTENSEREGPSSPPENATRLVVMIATYINTRAYGAIAPEPLGCALHSYLTEESVTDKRTNKRTNERTHIANY